MKTICRIFLCTILAGIWNSCDIPNQRDPEVQKLYEMDSQGVGNVPDTSNVKEKPRQIPQEVKKIGRELREELNRLNAKTEVELTMNFVDSTWDFSFYKIEKGYSRFVFTYHFLSMTLSKEKLDLHMRQQLMRSCMVDEYASKKMEFNGFFLEPGCGSINNKEEEKLVDLVYAVLKKLGAKETKDDFLVSQLKNK